MENFGAWHTTRMRLLLAAVLGGLATPAYAMTGPMVDTVADVLAVVVLIFVPIAAVYLFWIVHVLPEKIAEKRHHPQKDAIKALCLLSLLFGGMLWPIAWIWAYSKPVMHKLAYGTDKHEDYYKEADVKVKEAQQDVVRLRSEIDQLESAEHDTAAHLAELRSKLAKLEARLADTDEREAG